MKASTDHDAVAALDEAARRIRSDDDGLDAWATGYFRAHRFRFLEDIHIISRYVESPGPVLEIGCVPPFLTATLRTLGYAVSGVDLAPARFASVIRELHLDIAQTNIERQALPFDDGTFPAVIMNEVFEHLRIDPIFTLDQVRRVLVPGGRLLLSTPNLYSYRGIVNFLIRQRSWAVAAEPFAEFLKLRTLGHMGHVREYTTVELRTFLAAAGFEIERVIHRGAPASVIERVAIRISGRLRPYQTIIARRPTSPG